MTNDKISRRSLGGLAAAGAGLPLLAACGSGSSDSAADPAGTPTAGSTGASGGGGLTSTSDIEVGGGAIFPGEEVVVTQPSAGQFKCFTAICTHQGCVVSSVSDGTINCGCHGSSYDIATGEVVNGPATAPLAEEQITVSGDEISLA
jgi:nitrite reductase/ring-hydroxylating ferredoxin subunit